MPRTLQATCVIFTTDCATTAIKHHRLSGCGLIKRGARSDRSANQPLRTRLSNWPASCCCRRYTVMTFYDFSHGFRAGHSQHQALEELSRKCWELNVNWIVDADVSGLFDNLDHSILREFMQKRLNDGGIKRLIGKWLNAEVVDKGMWTRSEQGTPQRGGELTIASKYLSSLCVGRMVRKGRPIPYAGSLLSHSLRR
jgi:hypothetical protein